MKTKHHKKLLAKRTRRNEKREWIRLNEERGSFVTRRANKARFFKNKAAIKQARLTAQKKGESS